MFDWSFWKGFIAGGALVALALLKGATAIKAIWPSRAKPRLLDFENGSIWLKGCVWHGLRFEFLVSNLGSKDCSIISVKLTWAGGGTADIVRDLSTLLPITISPGQTERIIMYGRCRKLLPLRKGEPLPPVYPLPGNPEQKSIEGTVAVKFNTGKTIKKKITFTIFRRS